MVFTANFIVILISFIYMNSFNNNNSEKGNNNVSENIEVNIADVNKKIFGQVADLIAENKADIHSSRAEKESMSQEMVSNRVIDIPNSYVKTAKLNLTSNGALLLSINDGKQLLNHPINRSEKNDLSNIVNDNNLSDDQKIQKVSQLVSTIAISDFMKVQFDKDLSQNMSHTLHR